MTPRQRLVLFSVAAAGLVSCYLWAFTGLPGFGNYPGPYGQAILAHAIALPIILLLAIAKVRKREQ